MALTHNDHTRGLGEYLFGLIIRTETMRNICEQVSTINAGVFILFETLKLPAMIILCIFSL